MKFLNEFFSHSRLKLMLALYADGELSHDETVAVSKHLESCARCRQELDDIICCRELLKTGVAPQVVPTEKLWQRIVRKTSGPRQALPTLRHTLPTFGEILSAIDPRYIPWTIAVAVIFLSLGIWKVTNIERRNEKSVVASSAIDYSIFLDDARDDFSGGNFYKRYRAQLVSLDEAQESVSFPLAAIDALPESYLLDCVRVFECNGQKCILFSCNTDGKTVSIFQHALGQTWTLGKYAVARTPICNVPCLLVNTTDVAAVSWQGKKSEYLAVGDFTPQEIEQVVHVLQ
jgi:hypothetical protein